jgi:hypothetical protein
MRRLGQRDLDAYLADDWIDGLLTECAREDDAALVCQRWLAETPAKRLIFAELYGELLDSGGLRILDVGGGLTSLTRRLAEAHRYELIDFMAHDPPAAVARFRASVPGLVAHEADWSEVDLAGPYDIVLANDLFPNVDQRLGPFLHEALPICGEIRLSLTYYNEPRGYRAKRVGADEILSVLAWNGPMTRLALEPYADRIHGPDMGVFDANRDSIFPNRRQICLVALKGDLFRA